MTTTSLLSMNELICVNDAPNNIDLHKQPQQHQHQHHHHQQQYSPVCKLTSFNSSNNCFNTQYLNTNDNTKSSQGK